MPSLDQLYAFVTTVQTGSFSAAARRLGKVQSAISQNIMNMEIDTNQTLFDRSGRYPILTAAGEALLPQAEAVIAQHQRLNFQLEAINNHEPLKITLAIDEGIPYLGLTELLPTLVDQYPQLQLEFLSASSQDVLQLVSEQRADTGLIFSELSYPKEIDFETIGAIAFDVFVSTQHPLAQQPAAHLDILKLHRQLVIGSKGESHSWLNQAHSPDVWYSDNYYVLLELTKSGFGWALLPEHLAQDAVLSKQLCRLPFEHEQLAWQTNIDLIHRTGIETEVSNQLRKRLRSLIKKQ
jgi:DNA-binding transcriptional LysR family regulator